MARMNSSNSKDAPTRAVDVAALFDPNRLRQARRLATKTKQALALEAHVSPAAIGQFEAGVAAPRPDILEALAHSLNVPVRFFAIGRPLAPLDSADAHFKSLRSTTVGQRNKALAYTEQVWELTHLLERWVQFPPVNLPEEVDGDGPNDRARLRLAAAALRERWGIALDVPFPYLTRTAEANGIVVVFATFADDDQVKRISAFSTSRLSRPIVVTPPDRIDDVFTHRFNLAHELGHFVLHRDEVHGEIEIEREADAFAGELLLPEKAMRNVLGTRIEWERLANLSQVWGVEMKALIYRSRQLDLLSDAAARRAYQRLEMMKSAGLVKPSPTARYEGEMPVLLRRAFDYAESEGVDISALADELAWRPSTVARLLGSGDPRPQLKALL
jgi:Zn-dependent peptidase ImmA (M78 family)/transcriptional regulator with XRE-family HTH domain